MKKTEAYAEIDIILKYLPNYYSKKIPLELKEMFRREKSTDYQVNINKENPLDKSRLKQETLVILAVLKYNFWCKDNQEKQALAKLLNKNEKKYQQELSENYNLNNIFNNK